MPRRRKRDGGSCGHSERQRSSEQLPLRASARHNSASMNGRLSLVRLSALVLHLDGRAERSRFWWTPEPNADWAKLNPVGVGLQRPRDARPLGSFFEAHTSADRRTNDGRQFVLAESWRADTRQRLFARGAPPLGSPALPASRFLSRGIVESALQTEPGGSPPHVVLPRKEERPALPQISLMPLPDLPGDLTGVPLPRSCLRASTIQIVRSSLDAITHRNLIEVPCLRHRNLPDTALGKVARNRRMRPGRNT